MQLVGAKALRLAVLLVVLAAGGRAADLIPDSDCLDCHSDQTLVKTNGGGRAISLFVDAAKLRASMTLALRKRPVSVEQIDAAVERIQEKLLNSGAREVASARVGELVMRELKRIDKVAYVRFASVYRSFEDVDEFRQLIRDI